MALYIISLIALITTAVAFFAFYKYTEERRKFAEIHAQFAMASSKQIELSGYIRELENEKEKWHERAIAAETSFSQLKIRFTEIEAERIDAIQAKEQAEKNFHVADKQIELVNQQIAESEKRINDWEAQREKAFKDAREAMFQTGREVFTREAEELNKKTLKESEEISKKTKEHFDSIIKQVNVLSSQVEGTDKDIKLVIKSMSSPTAVGQFSEIGLANILKDYGLEEGKDFKIQYNINTEEGAKRPDAVLFVRNNIFIIDSKASKFFLELAEFEGTEREPELIENMKRTMNKHLADLSSKGYKEALLNDIKKNNPEYALGHVQTVMFLCNESHVNKISYADPEFINKSIANNIVISGPTGLQGLLAFAKYSLDQQKREEGREKLIHEIRNLLGSISTVMSHALKLGNSIKSSAKHYDSLATSMNSNLLSKANNITKLGMPMPSNKALPGKLETFEITTHSASLIEADAVVEEAEDEASDVKILELAVG